jgi:nucleolar pre-ribosomal-associated protein 1
MVISPVTKLISEEKTIPEEEKESIINKMIDDAPVATEDHGALVRWTAKDVEEVVEGGHLASLIMLLSSEHLHIRREASVNISKFAAKLKESIFEEKEQIWLLLCELVESAKKAIDEGPLSTIVTTFASHAVKVLNDPLHCMYPKLNKFLSQGPTWELDKVPLLYKVLDESPSLDDAYYQEVSWLLTYMLAGLRSAQDMAVYRRRRVFEKLFSLWNSSYLAPGLRDRILRILYRATTIEGGSTTLITRFSTMTWLEAQVALGAGTPLKVLLERILESPDKKRVGKWAKGVDRIKPEMVKC